MSELIEGVWGYFLFLLLGLSGISTGFELDFWWIRAGFLQTEIAKRLNAIIAQVLPFLAQEHQQQVATAVERAKQVTMTELNAIIGVRSTLLPRFYLARYMHDFCEFFYLKNNVFANFIRISIRLFQGQISFRVF